MINNALSINSMTHEFAGRQIFSNFALNLVRGDKAALVGKSGSGKSTLMNIIMGFVQPENGEINILGYKVNSSNINALRRRMCWLPQNVNLIGAGKLIDVIMNPFIFAGNKQQKPSETYIAEQFAKLNLEKSLLNSDFSQLSGGERQRVGLVICKLLGRELALLDEPTSALDKDSRMKAAEMFLRDDGTTVLSASHDEEWLGYCNKIIEI